MTKDEIIIKIQKLLRMTTANGCSEAEAKAALGKAEVLMREYRIEQSQLVDPFEGERIVERRVLYRKSRFPITTHIGALGKLFDVITTEQKEGDQVYVCAFGFETDVDLCLFFVDFIDKSLANETKRIMYTEAYDAARKLKQAGGFVHSFVSGFTLAINSRIHDLYEARQIERGSQTGLVLLTKKQKVEAAFGFGTLQKKKSNLSRGHGFHAGVERGYEVPIQQGLSGSPKPVRRALKR